MNKIKKTFQTISGEISRLREKVITSIMGGTFGPAYKVDSSEVDYKLARELYENTNDKYKLGAGFAKPVINTAVGFMGVPTFLCEDPEAQDALETFFADNVSLQQQTHRDAMRDGTCWVYLTREEDPELKILFPETDGVRLVYTILPPELVMPGVRDPVTQKVTEYVLKSSHEWKSDKGESFSCKILQRISAERKIIEVEGDLPEGMERKTEEANQWGFIPIQEFYNEKDSSQLHGRSDLESMEPFLKAYHDVFLHAIQGSKLHSTPRLKLNLKSIESFLMNNFGVANAQEFVNKGGTVDLDGHEIVFLQDDDKMEFVEAKSTTGGAKDLLKLLFYCIVDVSETPEFAFGTHIQSSQASVKEQMPILIRRITRKRECFTESWQRLSRMVLAMLSEASGKKYSTYQTTLKWDEIDPRDEKEVAEVLKIMVEALALGVQSSLISQEAAVNYLSEYVDTMAEWDSQDKENPGERSRIMRDKINMNHLEDADAAKTELQLLELAMQANKKKEGQVA